MVGAPFPYMMSGVVRNAVGGVVHVIEPGTGQTQRRTLGEAHPDGVGRSCAWVGDLSGDGIGEVVVGRSSSAPVGVVPKGESGVVVFDGATGAVAGRMSEYSESSDCAEALAAYGSQSDGRSLSHFAMTRRIMTGGGKATLEVVAFDLR